MNDPFRVRFRGATSVPSTGRLVVWMTFAKRIRFINAGSFDGHRITQLPMPFQRLYSSYHDGRSPVQLYPCPFCTAQVNETMRRWVDDDTTWKGVGRVIVNLGHASATTIDPWIESERLLHLDANADDDGPSSMASKEWRCFVVDSSLLGRTSKIVVWDVCREWQR